MSRRWKPDDYTSVSPYLVTDRPEDLIDFLVAVIGAERIRQFTHDDEDAIVHAEVRIDDSVVMIGGAGGEDWTPVPSHVHVYVPDVDRVYAAALAHGAESVQEPMQKDDPDRRCGVVGPGGITWWFSTMLES